MLAKAGGVIMTTRKLKIQSSEVSTELIRNSSGKLTGCGGDGVGGSTDGQWCNLSRIQPSHAEPSNGEERVEDEEENGL